MGNGRRVKRNWFGLELATLSVAKVIWRQDALPDAEPGFFAAGGGMPRRAAVRGPAGPGVALAPAHLGCSHALGRPSGLSRIPKEVRPLQVMPYSPQTSISFFKMRPS